MASYMLGVVAQAGTTQAGTWITTADWPGLLVTAGVVLLQVVACVVIGDFVSGFVHWLEDSYFTPETPLIGKSVIEPNIVHHHDPRRFVHKSWFEGADMQLGVAAVVLVIAWLAGWWHWMLLVTLIVTVNANELHKWAHRSRTENGRVIVFLQQLGLVQTPAHHAGHHRGERDTRYCVVTNYLNPVLDGLGFWRGLEWLVYKTLGVSKRPDPPEPTYPTKPMLP